MPKWAYILDHAVAQISATCAEHPHKKALGSHEMTEIFSILSLIAAIAFIVLLVIYVIDKIRKRQGSIRLRTVMIAFVVALAFLSALVVTMIAQSKRDAHDQDPKAYQSKITYNQVARNPEQFDDKKLKFTGRVLQVINVEDDEIEVPIAVDNNEDHVMIVEIDRHLLKNASILEDDLITVSGIGDGTKSYNDPNHGHVTVPYMEAKIVNNRGDANDIYEE